MTPLILVAGFLGAGKTTFVRELLLDARRQGLNIGVIINEFGAVDVDGALLRDAARDLATIAGGCACCAGQDDFLEAVQTMSQADFDFLVVEASGLADPLVLLESLAAPELLKRVRVNQILCVADASHWNQSAGALGPLMRRQLMLADAIILSKTDLIGAQAIAAVREKVAELNSGARVEIGVEGANFWECEFQPKPISDEKAVPHANSHTLWVALPHPLERAALEGALNELNDSIWRAKGFVRLRGAQGLQLVQLSGGPDGHRVRVAPFAAPFGAPEPELGLVFIGGAFDASSVRRSFEPLGFAL